MKTSDRKIVISGATGFIGRLITPVPPSVPMLLIEGLKNEAVCRENSVREIIPIRLTPCDEAVHKALAE